MWIKARADGAISSSGRSTGESGPPEALQAPQGRPT